jgi:hypothetical protein
MLLPDGTHIRLKTGKGNAVGDAVRGGKCAQERFIGTAAVEGNVPIAVGAKRRGEGGNEEVQAFVVALKPRDDSETNRISGWPRQGMERNFDGVLDNPGKRQVSPDLALGETEIVGGDEKDASGQAKDLTGCGSGGRIELGIGAIGLADEGEGGAGFAEPGDETGLDLKIEGAALIDVDEVGTKATELHNQRGRAPDRLAETFEPTFLGVVEDREISAEMDPGAMLMKGRNTRVRRGGGRKGKK